jgi:hypothetical protein
MSISLKKLGKLAMAESELRTLMRNRRSLNRRLRVRALLPARARPAAERAISTWDR